MSDKLAAHRFFVEHGIASPRSWAPEDVPADARYPLLVKARAGFGSRHIYRADDPEQLDFFLRYTTEESFVQERCLGEEFSIDVFCDMDGRCLNAIPRTMLLSKGGESIKGASIQDLELIEHGARVAEAVGIKGPANVQCFREPDGSLPVTDVNTRFGGGFPVPLAAGGRYPELALALARGERPEPRLGDFEEGVLMTRFFSEVCLRGTATARCARSRPSSGGHCRRTRPQRRAAVAQGSSRDPGFASAESGSCAQLAFRRCATSSPAPPASSAPTCCARSSSAVTTRRAGTPSRTTTTRR